MGAQDAEAPDEMAAQADMGAAGEEAAPAEPPAQ